jgi:phosphoribosylformylglycinamidine synthase
VREKAQEKVFSHLGQWRLLKGRNPRLVIAVGGCVASQEGAAILDRAPFVDLVFGPQTLHRLPEMLAALKELIPGAESWPRFVTNASERYEARLSLVEIPRSRSVLMVGMHGSLLPVVVAHGEGRADMSREEIQVLNRLGITCLKFVDNRGVPTEGYPANPNGSPLGVAGVTSMDGRVTAIMPHPERVFRSVQNSWRPREWGEDGGWMRLFRNARVFLS